MKPWQYYWYHALALLVISPLAVLMLIIVGIECLGKALDWCAVDRKWAIRICDKADKLAEWGNRYG